MGGRYVPRDRDFFYDQGLRNQVCFTGVRIPGPEDGPWVECSYCDGTGGSHAEVLETWENEELVDVRVRWKPVRMKSKTYVVDAELAKLWRVPMGVDLNDL